MNKKHNKVYWTKNYIEHSLILVSVVTGCVSISDFASLVGISTGIINYAVCSGVKNLCSNCRN